MIPIKNYVPNKTVMELFKLCKIELWFVVPVNQDFALNVF